MTWDDRAELLRRFFEGMKETPITLPGLSDEDLDLAISELEGLAMEEGYLS